MAFALPDQAKVENNPNEYSIIMRNWWRIMFAFPILAAILLVCLLTFCFQMETPRFYANNQDQMLVSIYIYIYNSSAKRPYQTFTAIDQE